MPIRQLQSIKRKGQRLSVLYHYAGNQKGFGILESHSIRLSDIRKSNDYNELLLFYPDIFYEILQVYREKPYDFKYESLVGEKAITCIIDETMDMISDSVDDGDFSNFVLCFSEEPDMLSQWRGYANDGKGISIGFSKELLQQKCNEEKSVFRLEKVSYISEERRKKIVRAKAVSANRTLKGLRKWIVKEITLDDASEDTDGLLLFNFHGMIQYMMTDSLRYKQIGFREEKEWRLFLSDQAYKNPEWVVGEGSIGGGPKGFAETLEYLRNKIEFSISDNNIMPFVPLPFSDLGDGFVKEIWVGPKSRIALKDIELYLAKNNYKDVSVQFSRTSYR